MSNIVKRLSFCVVQTPTYIDAIQNSQATQYRKSPNEGYLINRFLFYFILILYFFISTK